MNEVTFARMAKLILDRDLDWQAPPGYHPDRESRFIAGTGDAGIGVRRRHIDGVLGDDQAIFRVEILGRKMEILDIFTPANDANREALRLIYERAKRKALKTDEVYERILQFLEKGKEK